MSDPMQQLIIATIAFVAWHFVAPYPAIRDRISGGIGERGYLILFSAVSAALLIWIIIAYRQAPVTVLWPSLTAVRHLTGAVMLIACILIFAGMTIRNPTAVGGELPEQGRPEALPGILKITRHPANWGIGLWGVMHVAANGDAASAVMFGGFAALALFGPMMIDRRKKLVLGDKWDAFAAETSYIPFAAILAGRAKTSLTEIGHMRVAGGLFLYGLLLALHEPMFGIWPLWVG